LAMLTIVTLATATAALRAAWDKYSKSAHLICCAYGLQTMRQYYYYYLFS